MSFEMHEPNYRAFLYDEPKWIYGHYVGTDDKSYIVETKFPNHRPLDMIELSSTSVIVKLSRVDSLSLGLCTGTKDFEETMIYTGDIIETIASENSPFSEKYVAVVIVDNHGFYASNGVESMEIDCDFFKHCRVVGNAYENAELIKSLPNNPYTYKPHDPNHSYDLKERGFAEN